MTLQINDLSRVAQERILSRIVEKLNEYDEDDFFGPEGWWHDFFGDDLTMSPKGILNGPSVNAAVNEIRDAIIADSTTFDGKVK